MKVVILTHTFPRFPGDTAAPFMGVLTEALSKYIKPYVLTPFDEKLSIPLKLKYKIVTFKYFFIKRMHILGYSRTLRDDKKIGLRILLLAPFYILMGSLALFKLVKKEKIDLISAHWIIPNGFISFAVSKICKVPYTVTIPGSDIYLASKNKLFFLMTKLAAENASAVISDNQRYLDQLLKLKIKTNKTLVINYGVDPTKFKIGQKDKELMSKFQIKKGELVLMSVGRLVQKKGFLYLIRAAAILKRRNIHFKLIIIGSGDRRQILINEMHRLKISDQIFFTGMINHQMLSKYYNLADIFIMPSIKDDEGNIDASPVALMEAMLSGLMVVTTEGTIDKSLSNENQLLKFTKERNPQQIAAAIIELNTYFEKNQDLERIRNKIRRTSLKQFSAQSIAKKYQKLYNSLS